MIRSSITAYLFALLALAPPATLAAQVETPPLEVFYGFTLIDGRGGPPIEDAAMAIRGNEILTISSRRELLSGPNAPRDAIVVNLGGGFVIPGLVDSHVHLATSPDRARAEAELHRMLYSGVIAVRDMAGDARALASLARDSRLGVIEAPDVHYAALMAGPSFLSDPRPQSSAAGETAGEVPWMQAITSETDLVTAVALARGTSASGVKIYANLEPALVAGITREAHRQGIPVWAHSMVFPTRPLEVVRSGVDVVSHVCRLAWEGMAEAPAEYHHDQVPEYANFSAESPVFTELFQEMKARGTILDATLAMYQRADRSTQSEAASDRCDTGFARALVARAHAEGIPISAGTDFVTPPDDPYPALLDEIEELATNGGLGAMAAIEAGTRIAAEAIGAAAVYGTLAHGRPVSFVLLAADPLADIRNLRTVRAVWKNAVRYDRTAYRPRFAQEDEATAPVATGPQTAQQAFETWLGLWRRYDLDRLDDLFLNDAALTYFSSDAEGLKEGFDAVRRHHIDLGFVSGGFQPEDELWVEDVVIADFEDSAVVSGIWYFGNRVARATAGRGPLTMVVVRTAQGYRISHLHLGNYAPAG
jgi:imidazolonepropionase-like amidohydrolase